MNALRALFLVSCSLLSLSLQLPGQDPLPSGVARIAKAVNGHLARVEKTIASPGSRPRASWQAAKGYLEQAERERKKALSRYGSRFDQKHPSWQELTTRFDKCKGSLDTFYAKHVEGGGGKSGSTSGKSAYKDNQSMLPQSDGNRRSLDRSVTSILRETDKIRAFVEADKKSSDMAENSGYYLSAAKSSFERMLKSYGEVINKDSAEFKAVKSEIALAERRVAQLPKLITAYETAEAARKAEEKRLAAEAAKMSAEKWRAECERRAQQQLQAARFPKVAFRDAKLDAIARPVVAAAYPKAKILRLQVVSPFATRSEARIVDRKIEFGTYRYLRVLAACQRNNGKTAVYRLNLRHTLQPDNSWGPLQAAGSYDGSTDILAENVNK